MVIKYLLPLLIIHLTLKAPDSVVIFLQRGGKYQGDLLGNLKAIGHEIDIAEEQRKESPH